MHYVHHLVPWHLLHHFKESQCVGSEEAGWLHASDQELQCTYSLKDQLFA